MLREDMSSKEMEKIMLGAEALRREVNRLLLEIREDHENIKDIFVDLGYDDSKYHFILHKMENMYKLRIQLQELVGDAATAMIAKELGTDATSSERDTVSEAG